MGYVNENGLNYILTKIKTLLNQKYDSIYPVGCYFETTDTTFDPNISFVGTWELETEGLVHVSSGTNYAVTSNNQDGGNSSHSHTYSHTHNVPGASHYHVTPFLSDGSGGVLFKQYQPWNYGWTNIEKTAISSPNRQPVGSGAQATAVSGYRIGTANTTPATTTTNSQSSTTTSSDSNMQPYKIVNRWHRTA